MPLPRSSAEFGAYCATGVKINVGDLAASEMPRCNDLLRTHKSIGSLKKVLSIVKYGPPAWNQTLRNFSE